MSNIVEGITEVEINVNKQIEVEANIKVFQRLQ